MSADKSLPDTSLVVIPGYILQSNEQFFGFVVLMSERIFLLQKLGIVSVAGLMSAEKKLKTNSCNTRISSNWC